MIIHDLNVLCHGNCPTKTNPELIVYTDAVLPGTITFQGFKPVAGRYPQVAQLTGDLQLPQLAPRHGRDVGKAFNRLAP